MSIGVIAFQTGNVLQVPRSSWQCNSKLASFWPFTTNINEWFKSGYFLLTYSL